MRAIPEVLQDLRSRAAVWQRAEFDSLPRLEGRVWIHGGGRIVLGREVVLDAREAPIELFARANGVLRIGDGAWIEGGASIEAEREVVLGTGCRVGAFAKILDSNQHALTGERLRRPMPRPVHIGDDAELGPHAIVLPGATIPAGAHVRAGAVISGRTQPGEVELAPSEPRLHGLAWIKLERAIGRARAHLLLRGCEKESWRLYAGRGALKVSNAGRIALGPGVQFLGGMLPSALRCAPGASIEIGADALFNYGAQLRASRRIRIGKRFLIASHAVVSDEDESGIAPVEIGDDVWLAHGARVRPGTTIGAGSIVGAGAVVGGDVPPRSLVMGNPARCLPLKLIESAAPTPGAAPASRSA